jgi:hypothetical protein
MKTENSSGIMTFEAEVSMATWERKLVIAGTAAGQVKKATANTNIPIGVLLNAPAINENASVRLLNDKGSCRMEAKGVIALGAYVIPALVATAGDIGRIRTMTGVASETVYIVGIALEASTADGDWIEVMLMPAIQRVIA